MINKEHEYTETKYDIFWSYDYILKVISYLARKKISGQNRKSKQENPPEPLQIKKLYTSVSRTLILIYVLRVCYSRKGLLGTINAVVESTAEKVSERKINNIGKSICK